MQPWTDINDSQFNWPHRVEFLEQLIDLSQDTIYIVEPGELYNDNRGRKAFMVGEASCHTIVRPVMWIGNVAQPREGIQITIEDIPRIEDSSGKDCFLCSEEFWENYEKIIHVFRIGDILLIPLPNLFGNGPLPNFTSVFYDKKSAEKYRSALTLFLKNNYDAVSAFSRLI